MADESKRDEVVATALYAKVMEYAADLLSLEGVSDKHRELATRKLADGFNEMVAQDRMWETDEGKQRLQGVQNRLRALIDKHKSEGAPAWGESVREAPLCSHPTFANKR